MRASPPLLQSVPSFGDIWWVSFPARSSGHEQQGRRPAIITQIATVTLPTILVVPLTSQLGALRFPGTTIRIDPDAFNNLARRSVALVFQLGAVDARKLEQPIGRITVKQWHALLAALDGLMGRV